MRLAGIKRTLRLPPVPLTEAVGVIAKFSIAAVIAAAPLAAAPVTPASPEYDAVIVQALTLPVKDALRTLDSLSRVQSAPGWFRAKSLKLLGDHQFIKADYKKSADFYLQASKFDNSSMYKHLYALALAADGQTEAAKNIWSAIAGDQADPMSDEAAQTLAAIGAATHTNHNPQAGLVGQPPAPYSQPAPPPLVLPEAGRIDNKITVNSQVQQSTTVNSTSQTPEISQNKSPVPPANVDNKNITTVQVQQSTTVNPQNNGILYTVQVGAFGSRENAENLVRKLAGTYSDITVSPTTSGEQTLYRVRIGTFQNREDAVALADKLITTAGLSARVFEKQ